MANTSNLAQDFIAGVDPFGIYTSQYGQAAEQAGLSESQHAKKRVVGAIGGAVGGGVVLPTAVSGIAQGIIEGAKGGGPLASRLSRAAKGFVSGAKAPWQGLSQAMIARGAVRRAAGSASGAKLSAKELEAFKSLMSQARITDVLKPGGKGKGFLSGLTDTKDMAVGAANLLGRGRLTQQMAKKIQSPLSSGVAAGVGGLALGATVGAGGAAVQYSKGRQSEKKFQRRLAMNKLSSVQEAALWSAFDLEMDKISSPSKAAQNVAYGAGQQMRAIMEALKRPGALKDSLYRSYAQGYHGVPRNIKDVLTKAQRDIPASMLLIPGAAGVGAAVGAASKSKLRKKDNTAEAFERQYYGQDAYGEGL